MKIDSLRKSFAQSVLFLSGLKELSSERYKFPREAIPITLWQIKNTLGDGGNPFIWRKYDAVRHKPKKKRHNIILATYNCWRNSADIMERCQHIKNLILSSPADVICLQETSPFLLRELISTSGIMDKFIFSDISGDAIAQHHHKDGKLTLYRRKHIKVYRSFYIALGSTITQCSIIGWTFDQAGISKSQRALIINLHSAHGSHQHPATLFEKVDQMVRHAQWSLSIIMMGTFGLDENEQMSTEQHDWQDVAIKCDMESLSTSTGIDPNLPHRPDRILYKQCVDSLIPISVNVFGKEVIASENNENTFASTHLGVAAEFSISNI